MAAKEPLTFDDVRKKVKDFDNETPISKIKDEECEKPNRTGYGSLWFCR